MKLNAELTQKHVNEYKFDINGVEFWCPYFVNTPQVTDEVKQASLQAPFLGKGSAKELKRALVESLAQSGEAPSTPEAYRQYMHDHLIGVECSGFAYNIVSAILEDLGKGSLDKYIYWSRDELLSSFDKGIPWHQASLKRELVESYPEFVDLHRVSVDWGWKVPRRLVRAERFWSDSTASKVEGIMNAKPGDIIAMRENTGSNIGHLVIIVEANENTIRYAHSNRVDGTLGGVNYGEIKVTDATGPIEGQHWQDSDFFNTHDIYGIYRLTALADAN